MSRLVLLIVLGDGAVHTGTNWLDWLTVPWLGFMVFGLVLLFRLRASARQERHVAL